MKSAAAHRVWPDTPVSGVGPQFFAVLAGIQASWNRQRILDHMAAGLGTCVGVKTLSFLAGAPNGPAPPAARDFSVLAAGAAAPLTCRVVFEAEPDSATLETLGHGFTILGTLLAGRERRALEQVIGETADLIRDFVIITDNAGLITWVNPAFVRRTGYPLSAVVGRKPGAFLQGAATDAAEVARMRDAIAAREPFFGELLNYTQEGEPYWIEIDLSPFGDEDDGGFIAVERDISDRKQAFERLAATERHMRAIADTVPAIISVAAMDDPAKRFFVNRFWQDEYGVAADEAGAIHFPGTPFLDQVIEDLSHGHSVQNRPQVQTSIDGEQRHYRVFAERMDWHGQPAALVLKVDVTDQVALGLELEEARKYEELGLLAGRVAHDLNNRLQQMTSAWDLLMAQRADLLSDDKNADRIEAALKRLEEFGQSVLAFSRGRSMAPQFLDLGAALRRLAPSLQAQIPAGVRLDIDDALETLAEARVIARLDPVRLEDALSNCVDNACEAMPQGGAITIAVAIDAAPVSDLASTLMPQPEGTLTLSVIDNGAGMDDEVLAHALDPFFTTKRGAGGTGLGLSTVNGLAVRAGGKLSVHSRPGEGTRVDLILPRYAPSLLTHSDAGESRKRSRSKKVETRGAHQTNHVLVAEDEPEVRQALIDGLTAQGWRVTSAASGKEALAALDRQSRIDLIISDYALGEGPDGSDVAAAAKQRHPDAGFILITAGHEFSEVEKLGDIPAVLLKPFHFEQLYGAIAKAKPQLVQSA